MKDSRSPGFYFGAFALALAAAMVTAALLSPGVQSLIAPIKDAPLHRVFTRIAEVGLFGGTAWLLSRLGLFDRRLMGFGVPPAKFFTRLAGGFVAGLVLMIAAVLPLFAFDLRELGPHFGSIPALLLSEGPKALMTGLVVALVEETYFRGALQGAMSRRGASLGVFFAVPALYAAVHFLGKAVRIPAEQVDWSSGFLVLGSFFDAFGDPLAIADAFLALYLVGVLLALVRHRLGDIGACIGLHAGFVAIIVLFRKVSLHTDGSEWSWLVGSFDGLLGLWIAATTAVACAIAWRWLPRDQNGLAITK
ncbi:MAG: CPBP family intramembrane glutamic endopeptidase [Steroidobacteraceae bacterium]